MRNARNIDITQAFSAFRLACSCQFDRERVRNLPIKWHRIDTAPFDGCSRARHLRVTR